jgi:hypothetical protein
MFVKITVFIIAVGFILLLWKTLRERLSPNNKVKADTDSAAERERKNWNERIHKLPIPQLDFKLQELEKQKLDVMNNFLSMSTPQQYDAMAQVSEIKEKIEIIKEEMMLRGSFIVHLQDLCNQNSVSITDR